MLTVGFLEIGVLVVESECCFVELFYKKEVLLIMIINERTLFMCFIIRCLVDFNNRPSLFGMILLSEYETKNSYV